MFCENWDDESQRRWNNQGSFIENKHPRSKKEFDVNRHQPFGKTAEHVKCIESVDSEKMAKLIKAVEMLMQTKASLFPSRQRNKLASPASLGNQTIFDPGMV